MFINPVLWSDRNQITGDIIHLLSDVVTEKLDSLKVLSNAFIVSKDSLSTSDFNQIKGRNMFGKFTANKLNNLLVKGNAESVYYNRNEETDSIETITKEISSNIEFTLEKGQITTIKYLKTSEGKTYPPSLFPEDSRRLEGFIWRESEQPNTKEDIFKKGDDKEAPEKRSKDIKKPAFIEDSKKKRKDTSLNKN
jgi:hypothetical protein